MSESRAASLRALLFASSAAGNAGRSPRFRRRCRGWRDRYGRSAAARQSGDHRRQRSGQEARAGQPRVRRAPGRHPARDYHHPQTIIEQTSASSLQDLLSNSPGITFGAGEGGQPLADRPFIRGQSSGNNIFVDGLRDTGGQQREVFNLEQVEVIKGPDAVYSGRGSGGGSINLASKSPKLNAFNNISAGVGTDGYLRGTIDSNLPLGETAALRINLMGAQGDVPGRDAVDYDKWGLGLSLGAGLGTPSSMVFSYYHLTSDQMPDYGIPLFTKIQNRTTGQRRSGRALQQLLWPQGARLHDQRGGYLHLQGRASPERLRHGAQRQPLFRDAERLHRHQPRRRRLCRPCGGRDLLDEARDQDPLEPRHHPGQCDGRLWPVRHGRDQAQLRRWRGAVARAQPQCDLFDLHHLGRGLPDGSDGRVGNLSRGDRRAGRRRLHPPSMGRRRTTPGPA